MKNIVTESFFSEIGDKTHLTYKKFIFGEISDQSIHIILQHGLLEYHGRHQELIEYLGENFSNNGVVISCLDLVGHGLSGGNRVYVDKMETLVNDFNNFVKKVCSEFQGLNLFVIGHSLGGLLALKLTLNTRLIQGLNLKGTILANPCLGVPESFLLRLKDFIHKTPSWMKKLRIPIYNAKELTHDPDKIRDFISDHLISKFMTINIGLEILKETEKIQFTSYFLESPCLFILSGEDSIVDNEKTKLYISSMNKKHVERIDYPSMYHDIFNETCRKKVYKEIKKYIQKGILHEK